jgi:hypothetical protein
MLKSIENIKKLHLNDNSPKIGAIHGISSEIHAFN